MEEWELDLINTPNTISPYMMEDYQKMRYRRKYLSPNSVTEPAAMTGVSNNLLIGALDSSFNIGRLKSLSPVSRLIDVYNIATSKEKDKEAFKAVMGWGSGTAVLGISQALLSSAPATPLVVAAPYAAAAVASYIFAEQMGKAYEEAPVWAKTEQGKKTMNKAADIQEKQSKAVRPGTLSSKTIQKNLKQYSGEKKTGLKVLRDSHKNYISSYRKNNNWRKTADINIKKRYSENNYSTKAQAAAGPTKKQTAKSVAHFDRMIRRETKNVKNYWTKKAKRAGKFFKKHFGFLKNIGRNANGSLVTSPMLSWIGEEGPEAIIPLSKKRKARGLQLWKQAGQIMGVQEAEAFQHNLPEKSFRQKNNQNMSVSVGNVTISNRKNNTKESDINLLKELKEQRGNLSDEICSILADALEGAYKNIPTADAAK